MKPYTLFTSFKAKSGEGDAFSALLAKAAQGMATYPGCAEYRVFKDASDGDTVHVFESWTDEASHKKCLADPKVREMIAQGMPMISEVIGQKVLVSQ